MQFKKYRDGFVGMAFLDCSFLSIPCPLSTEKLRDRISSPIEGVRTQSSITQSLGLSLSLESKETRRGKSLFLVSAASPKLYICKRYDQRWIPIWGPTSPLGTHSCLHHQASTSGFLKCFPFTATFYLRNFYVIPKHTGIQNRYTN